MKNRIIYLDLLRIFATFAVVVLHVSGQRFAWVAPSTAEWQTLNLYDSLVRWTVPLFVMISGALFLSREIDIKTIFKKNILRLAVAYIFWSALYSVYIGGTLKEILLNTVRGHYHMWFIPMIAGLYICIPVFKKIVSDHKTALYFISLTFIFASFFPTVVRVVNDFGEGNIVELVNACNKFLGDMNFNLVLGYSGYFVAGYYFSCAELKKNIRWTIYILGALGLVGTVWANSAISLKLGVPATNYYGNLSLNVMLPALSLFVWFRYNTNGINKCLSPIKAISKYSFGAYLIHAHIIEVICDHFGITSLSINPLLAVPILSSGIFVLSIAVSALLNQIPILKKYIV